MKNNKLNAIKLQSIIDQYKIDNSSVLYAYLNAKIAKYEMLEKFWQSKSEFYRIEIYYLNEVLNSLELSLRNGGNIKSFKISKKDGAIYFN